MKDSTTNIHKKAFSEIVRDMIGISEIILEVLDSRFIEKTRVHELEKEILSQGKKLIFILNKCDLVDKRKLIKEGKLKDVKPYVFISSKRRRGKLQLIRKLKIELSKIDIPFRKANVGVIGYPNTGKSTLINYLAGRKAAKTSSESHYTKGIQKIKLTKDILLLDTPGIVPFNEDNLLKNSIIKKAEIGAESYAQTKDPELVFSELMKKHSKEIEDFYKIEHEENYEAFIFQLGRKLNFLSKGNKINLDKTYRKVIKDWQEGKILANRNH